MANLCKFDKKQYQVSYDSGVTWVNVTPEQISKGDNMIEYDSQDCSSVDTMYRWRTLDGQYLCDGKEKWTKEIQEESYNNGLTWYTSYPTVYRRGTYVGIDEDFCNDKFVGHYVYDGGGGTSSKCPQRYAWNGYRCVYIRQSDPLKVVKCNNSSVLTSDEISYYTGRYRLYACEIGDCVTTIDNLIFRNNAVISSVTISNSVTTIGDYAFQGCGNLTRINSETNGVFNVPSSAIGGQAFKDCTSLSSVTISESIISIGGGAFRNCSSLTSITINALIPPTLGDWAFLNTNNCPIYVPCASVVLYKRAKTWSDYASRIQAIEDSPCELTPTGATKIQATYSNGENYFIHCNSSTELISREARPNGYDNSTMTSAEIGDCVTKIGYQAFLGCSSLSSFDIPSGVTSISDSAFSGCTSLTSITVHATTPPSLGTDSTWATHVFDNTNNCPIYVPCNSLPLYKPRYPWSHYASRIQGIESPCKPTPSGATKIYLSYNNGEIYFKYSDDNTTLSSGDTRPDSYNYAKIESAVIGNYITNISLRTFYGCTSLTSIDIPSGVTEIGERAFQDCTSLSAITIPSGVTSIGGSAFASCTSLKSIDIPSGVTSIDGGTFYACSSLSSVTIPDSVTSIGYRAFSLCTSLPSITIPYGITSISDEVFRYCTSLSSVTIPDSVTSIGNNAFYNCTSLTSIDIPNSVTSIGGLAFRNCTNLSSVTIGSGITSIGEAAFNGGSILSFTCLASTPPTLAKAAITAQHIYVHCESLMAYKLAWSNYSSIIEAIESPCEPTPTGATKIQCTYSNGDVYFKYCDSSTELSQGDTKPSGYNCTAMTSCLIGDCVTSIGRFAFGSFDTSTTCRSLTSVTISDSVTTIDTNAFSYCSGLTSVNIPSSVISIGFGAFYGCTSLPIENNLRYADTYLVGVTDKYLSTYTIKEGTRFIGSQAFRDCSSLTSIDIPSGVTTISDYAFSDCDSLTSVTIPDSVITISDYAFWDCTSLTSVTLGSGVRSIGFIAFYGCSGLTGITVLAPTPPSLGRDVFDDTNNCPIYVPAASVDAYKSSWSSYADRIQPIT